MATVGLLSGIFDGGSPYVVWATAKDRSLAGPSRSPKHNSIANYYRDLHRPAEQSCVDEALPQRVRDATAIFTGTVRDMVDDSKSRHWETWQLDVLENRRLSKNKHRIFYTALQRRTWCFAGTVKEMVDQISSKQHRHANDRHQ